MVFNIFKDRVRQRKHKCDVESLIGYRNIVCTKNSTVMGPIFKPFVYGVLSPAIFW